MKFKEGDKVYIWQGWLEDPKYGKGIVKKVFPNPSNYELEIIDPTGPEEIRELVHENWLCSPTEYLDSMLKGR